MSPSSMIFNSAVVPKAFSSFCKRQIQEFSAKLQVKQKKEGEDKALLELFAFVQIVNMWLQRNAI